MVFTLLCSSNSVCHASGRIPFSKLVRSILSSLADVYLVAQIWTNAFMMYMGFDAVDKLCEQLGIFIHSIGRLVSWTSVVALEDALSRKK